MCCLKNEEDVYEELNRKMPGIGDFCKAKDGLEGEVSSVNILRQTVKILVDVDDEKEVHEYKLEELETIKKKQKPKKLRRSISSIHSTARMRSSRDCSMKSMRNLNMAAD